jgi:hypothetical protein
MNPDPKHRTGTSTFVCRVLDVEFPSRQSCPREELQLDCGFCYSYSLEGAWPDTLCSSPRFLVHVFLTIGRCLLMVPNQTWIRMHIILVWILCTASTSVFSSMVTGSKVIDSYPYFLNAVRSGSSSGSFLFIKDLKKFYRKKIMVAEEVFVNYHNF